MPKFVLGVQERLDFAALEVKLAKAERQRDRLRHGCRELLDLVKLCSPPLAKVKAIEGLEKLAKECP